RPVASASLLFPSFIRIETAPAAEAVALSPARSAGRRLDEHDTRTGRGTEEAALQRHDCAPAQGSLRPAARAGPPRLPAAPAQARPVLDARPGQLGAAAPRLPGGGAGPRRREQAGPPGLLDQLPRA